MVKTHISPKGINQGGFPQNHVADDGDDMAVHNVGIREIDRNVCFACPSVSSWANKWFGCNTDDSSERRAYGRLCISWVETTVRCTNNP